MSSKPLLIVDTLSAPLSVVHQRKLNPCHRQMCGQDRPPQLMGSMVSLESVDSAHTTRQYDLGGGIVGGEGFWRKECGMILKRVGSGNR